MGAAGASRTGLGSWYQGQQLGGGRACIQSDILCCVSPATRFYVIHTCLVMVFWLGGEARGKQREGGWEVPEGPAVWSKMYPALDPNF